MSTLIPFIFGIHLGPAHTLILLSGLVAFLASTWEEWHTGILYLGVVSGPVEGAWSLALASLITGIYGSTEIWTQPRTFLMLRPFAPCDLAVCTFVLGSCITFVTSCVHVIKRSGYVALGHMLWPLFYFASCWSVTVIAPEIYYLQTNFYWFTFFCGLPACLRVSSTIVNYVTKFRLPSPTLLEVFPLLLMITKWLGLNVMVICKLLTLISAFTYARFVYLVVGDLCVYLNINCLTITKKAAQ